MKKLKIVYVISDIDKALAFEWISLHFRSVFDLKFILIGKEKPELSNFLNRSNISCTIISDSDFPKTYQKVIRIAKILKAERPDIIHSHLWRANLISQPIAWLLRIRKRIYTRHHATIHYNEFPSGRKWDVLLNSMVTDIVAISTNIKEILVTKDKADPNKIVIIPHGFDLSYFNDVSHERTIQVKERHKIKADAWPIVGVISRYLEWKGVHFTIDAFRQLQEQYPNAHLILANTQGNYSNQIRQKLRQLNENSFTEIQFEHDVAALFKVFTLYVHVPVDPYVEAFGQTYIEALAAGVPSVFTLSGVAREFIMHEKNALVVPFKDSDSIRLSIERLLQEKNVRDKLVENGKQSILQFELRTMLDQLLLLYGK
jgi:glycosyltransferase involved in cell wall biosynthesis